MFNSHLSSRPRPLWLAALSIAVGVMTASVGQAGQSPPSVKIDLDQAIQLALAHNHALRAARTQIEQSRAAEITAAIRPNPLLVVDYLPGIPLSPSQFTSDNLNLISEFDAGATFTFERGHKRQARISAARDQTAVTQSLVSDNERTLTFNAAQQFVNVLLAKSTLDFAKQDLDSFQNTVGISESQYQAGAISEGDLLKIKLQLLTFQTDVS